jgi:hypothetical protein
VRFPAREGAERSHRVNQCVTAPQTMLSADPAPDRPYLVCGFGKVLDQVGGTFPKQIRDKMKDRFLQKETVSSGRSIQAVEVV